ncbi:MAG TPA: AMP-binding protein, partial [Acidimicrobiales bacterium]|nr:AMP-binding protein [Acidimicrobiales bacterium]
MPSAIADVFAACDPSHEALVTRTQRLNYGELDALCARATGALAAMGVTAGDRVAACLPNEVEVVAAFHATMRLGAIWVGVNKALAPPEKQFILDDSGAAVSLDDAVALAEAIAAADPREAVDVDPFAPAGIAYTSGTTGFPKGAVHSQYNLLMP